MRTVRQPAVAGRFYPGRPAELDRTVKSLLASANATAPVAAERHSSAVPAEPARPPDAWPAAAEAWPKALIVPHAGYVYSGPTAACGYVRLEPGRSALRRVVLVGPAHYVGFSGLATTSASAFATPLGEVALDVAGGLALQEVPGVRVLDEAHAPEHSLEVQLPFLQRVLDDFELLPILVGDASPVTVASVLQACWGEPETLLLVSSDLSHYLGYEQAERADANTVRRILELSGPLPDAAACGGRGINGLLLAAASNSLLPQLLDYRNSGDTAGDRNRVVGYASIEFRGGADVDS